MPRKESAIPRSKEIVKTVRKNSYKVRELSPGKLRWTCPVSKFRFKSTESLEPLDQIVGQPRAIEAIRLGSELFSKGYNIFVSGLSGTGRLTTVRKILEGVTTHCPLTYDFCYVYNFNQPDNPRLIKLEKGNGKKFAKLVEESITYTRRHLTKLFDNDDFRDARRKIIEEYQAKEREILEGFDKKIKPHGFIRGQLENEQGINQPEVFPIIENEPIQIESLDDLVDEGKVTSEEANEKRELYRKFHNEIFDLVRHGMQMMKDFRKAVAKNDRTAARGVIESAFEDVLVQYPIEKVEKYIAQVKNYILDNLNLFVTVDESMPVLSINENDKQNADHFRLFEVNVVLDNSETDCAPVVVETTPSYTNLFGTIERLFDKRGFWRTDFTKIKAGSLLKADQGYIIVNASDLFTEPGVWNALKRVLLYDKLEIQPFDSYMNLSQSHLKPEPIDVNVKVIIIGGQTLYRMLYLYEKGFKKIFKVNAQFDYECQNSDDLMKDYARFIAKICREDNLPHCKPDGVAAIIEWAVEHAGSKERITLKFSDVADILREAAFYIRGTRTKLIDRKSVQKAVSWRRHRNDLIDDKIKYSIMEGNTMIDTDGARIGQINGLTVYDTGILSFGKPARITATISAGNSGIINIEREVDMSGSIHNKGVLILTGFMRERFAQKRPLSLTASIAFEQNYGGIDGDSATAAEIYVLISSISGVPIRQDMAITGSVNQKGDIQPIGGVNEKITGFFEICRDRGLTGNQGVIIPKQNVDDLMLCSEIIDAVKNKKFHIYPISIIEEGAEILMGMPVGSRKNGSSYQKDTLFGKVERRLAKLHKASKDVDDEESGSKKSRKKKPKKTEEEED